MKTLRKPSAKALTKVKLWPKNWRQCKPFVKALKNRNYVITYKDGDVVATMSDGVYLYLYELWQDGVVFGKGD